MTFLKPATYKASLLVSLSITLLGVTMQAFPAEDENEEATGYTASEQAIALAQNSIIVDGHIDVPHRVFTKWVDVTESTEGGDFDYPRAKAGGLSAPFMSIYVPAYLDGTFESTQRAHVLIDQVEAMASRQPDRFAIATSPDEVEEQFAKGLISLPLGMENGAPINDDLSELERFYERGVRYITLTHSKSNAISDSSYDENRQWGGLSPFGEIVVSEMNRLGIMVDISHVSDEAFYDVIKMTKTPVIASHSSLRTFTPGFERNMDDAMLKALAKNGGGIMINYGSTFIDAKSRKWSDARSAAIKNAETKMGKDSREFKKFVVSYRDKNPFPFSHLDKVIEHIDHAVSFVGVDYVGLGSDYDGVGDSLPIGLKDVASYPNLIQGLLDKQYSEADIKKILGGNLLRVWRQAEAFSAAQKEE